MGELYEVDPDGDLLAILPISDEPFAPWDDSDKAQGPITADAEFESAETTDVSDEGNPAPLPELQLKVSSKHLALASPRCKRMLAGPWLEANVIHPDGYRHWVLEGFDQNALKILLDIIHGKTRRVPRSIDLDMLAKIAVLVDDLECYEPLEIFSDMWIDQLEYSLPREYNRNLILWIFISSVFQKPKLFESATRTAIVYSTGFIRTLGLPIRDSIVESIDDCSKKSIFQLMSIPHDFATRLCGHDICSFDCDSRLLGAMVKQLYPFDMYLMASLPPDESIRLSPLSFVEMSRVVRGFRDPQNLGSCGRSLRRPLDLGLRKLEQEVKGLNLECVGSGRCVTGN